MAQVINTNALSLTAQNNLNKSQSMLGDAIERLSSGLRINSAKDDAAGQAIANRFTANVRGLTQAARNANDGISIAQTTEGALNEINNNLQRIRELTVQAQNGTNSKSDLTSIQAEITQRLDEIDRVSAQTQFNGVNVLAKDNNLAIQVGANDGQRIDIKLSEVTRKTLNLGKLDVTDKTNQLGSQIKNGDTIVLSSEPEDISFKRAANTAYTLIEYKDGDDIKYALKEETEGADAKVEYHSVTIKDDAVTTDAHAKATITAEDAAMTGDATVVTKNQIRSYDLGKVGTADGAAAVVGTGFVHEVTAKVDAGVKIYSLTDKDGNNTNNFVEEKVAADGTVSYLKVNTTGAVGGEKKAGEGKEDKDAKPAAGAVTLKADAAATAAIVVKPLDAIDKALAKVDDNRSQLGAIQNRFTSAIANLNNTVNNLSSARSRIEDADYATEVSNMTRAQILQQAGTAVLAQANQVPQNVLSLLK